MGGAPSRQRPVRDLLGRYAALLDRYVEEGGEEALSAGFELSRQALAGGATLVDLAMTHWRALERQGAALREPARRERAQSFFVECLGPYDMAQHGYRQVIRELQSQHERLAESNQALEDAGQEKEELTALIVHDLKNPLTGVIANLSFLKEEVSGATAAEEALGDALAAAEAMKRILSDLLEVHRAKSRGLTLRRQWLELGPMLEQVRRSVHRRAADKSQCLTVRVPERAGVEADPSLLRRVLENLADNAVKYSPAGAAIDIEFASTPDDVELRVRDGGPGIPVEARQAIFERFVQVGTARNPLSFGLGLVFCRLAVEAHGGRIWVEDNPGGGSCFGLALPRAGRSTT